MEDEIFGRLGGDMFRRQVGFLLGLVALCFPALGHAETYGALAIGPMLQGLNKPVNDLSRGCTVDDVFNTVIITAIQAQQK